jgi:hypothetical protein
MVDGVKDKAIQQKLISRNTWEKGIADLHKATGPEGIFTYTFFKAVADKREM